MPQIQVLGTPDLGLRPSETGAESFAAAARRGGAFFNQAADDFNQLGGRVSSTIRDAGQVAVDYMEHREISSGAAQFAALQDNLTKQWNETAKNADPNDPTVAQKFREEVLEPRLEQYGSGFSTEGGQRWSEQHVDALRNHMFAKTTADMSSLAGIAARQNVETTVNRLSSSVYSDPSSLDFALKTADSTLGAVVKSSPNLTPETAASVHSELSLKAKENIVKSAVSGMIAKNPNVDLDAIQKKYGDYINGGELKMFQKAAQTQAKANALVDKQTALAERQMADLQVHQGATKVISDNVSFDQQSGQPIVDPKFFKETLDIARANPNAPSAAETVRTMLNWGETQQNKGAKPADDPATKTDLMDRMFSPDKPTTTLDLMKARAEGKLSDHSFQAMHGLVQELEQSPLKGPIWQDTIGAVKGELILSGVGLPGKDVPGEANYAKWAQTFIPQYLAKSRTGTLPPNALDVKDPTSMISQSMAPFKRTVQQRAQDYLSTLGGVNPTGSTAPAPVVSGQQVPAPLRGIAALQYNAAKNLWRDQTSGTIYDASGREVK